MAILWCGGEDIDFSMGSAVQIVTTAGRFRSGYARCCLTSNAAGSYAKTLAFSGGTITSCWVSFRVFFLGTSASVTTLILGLVDSTTTASGLWVGGNSSGKLGLFTYDGSTKTQLVAESGTSWVSALSRMDLQLVNYGASSTVNLYCDGTLICTFSGDCTVSGVTAVDAIGIAGVRDASNQAFVSEIMVGDEDLRAFPGLVTLALTGAGTTDEWTGIFSTINQITISDANPNYVNLNDKQQQFNVTDLPSGTFDIRAVKLAARAAKAAGTPTQIALGYNSGGSVAVGSDIALTTAYATYEQLNLTNPVTTSAWLQSEMNGLQIEAKSRA